MASEKDSSQKLSTLISRSLFISSAGSYSTELTKNRTLVINHLVSLLNEVEVFDGGSASEGTQTAESDIDRMIVVPHIVVIISEDKDDLKTSDTVFLLDTTKSNPGYARLRLLHLVSNNEGLDKLLEENTEGVFLSSEKYIKRFISGQKQNRFSKAFYRHGPCATTEYIDRHGLSGGKPGKSIETDIANALVCLEWPAEAKEWLTRERLHNWPNKSLINKIRNKKCYVVPIGNPESEYHVLEWRISYLLCERELVWSFNDTQLHSYFILKRLLKLSLEKVAPDQLSSYHMKTIVFWLSEEKGLSMWFQENLLVCIEASLGRLYDCIKHRRLQHYFNSHANLFGHKLQNDIQRKKTLEKIEEIRTNITTYVLKCLPPEWKWPRVWEDYSSENYNSAKCGKDLKAFENNLATFKKASDEYDQYNAMFRILQFVTNEHVDYRSILLQMFAFEIMQPKEVYPQFIEMTKMFIYWRFSMAYFRELTVNKAFQAYTESEGTSIDDTMKLVSYSSKMDEMSGELYLATIHHFKGDYQKSTRVVNSLLHKSMYLLYTGRCSTYKTIQLTGDGLSKQITGIQLYGEERRAYAAYDVIFSYRDVHCVPYPLKFECALAEFDGTDNFIVIHPCIYANFLLCYGQYLSKNISSFTKSLQFLQMSVDETKGGRARYHALNILAFCYLLHGKYQKAMEYFRESMQETDKLGITSNAAAFHIAIILSKGFEKQKKTERAVIVNRHMPPTKT